MTTAIFNFVLEINAKLLYGSHSRRHTRYKLNLKIDQIIAISAFEKSLLYVQYDLLCISIETLVCFTNLSINHIESYGTVYEINCYFHRQQLLSSKTLILNLFI